MRIGEREITRDSGPYIIAEIGVNHDGSLDRALELIDAAADAGADAVKFQYFQTDRLMSRAAHLAAYQESAGETDPFAMLQRLEFSLDDLWKVARRVRERQIHAIVTVFSAELVEPAAQIGWDAWKTASPDIIHQPLIESLLATERPIVFSTGASTLEEVQQAMRWVETRRALDRAALLHCVSCYPTPIDDAALGGIVALREAFEAPVGYSDHTREIETGMLAVACGATILEKHFTYSREAPGPDHAASLEPDMFREYVELARSASRRPADAEPFRGPIEKRVLPCEQDVRHVSRQSIVLTHPMQAGAKLADDDLTIKRPGTGLPPFMTRSIVGRTLARDVAADMPLTMEDLQ